MPKTALAEAISPLGEPPMVAVDVQHRLGTLLAEAYARMPGNSAADAGRFDDLLARLETVLVAQEGRDEDAFRSEIIAMTPRLYNFAMSLTKNPSAADDLVQDTFLRAWRSRARFTVGTNLGAWLFTIMRNAFYSRHRKEVREIADSDGDYADRLAAAPEQSGHVDLLDAQTALTKLPLPMRQALILVAIENLSYEEAATVMNCRIGTVKSRVWRAREQLAQILGYDAADVGSDSMTLSAVGSQAWMS